ncbi:uncharacterized protein DSM5745_03907 [Aspergillus mulundensis]|uniref:Uncharacterized protein n=1 Tax=Aspergillus mulundensis TaxID=1810919 RepID=A0A3D8SBM6_9EURO|nr:hypothetical protein DSM5745_03907 [Aspergillus mulundensis]RDW83581.1 hypothetical protein DSM5745_03907 [Aspergillus mulundensis]
MALAALALSLASTSTAAPVAAPDSNINTVITFNGRPVTVPVDTANALHQAFASEFGTSLAKRQDVAAPAPAPEPAPAPAPAPGDAVMSPAEEE